MGSLSLPAVKMIALSVVLLVLATAAIILRLISSRIRKRTLANHDFLCLFSLFNLVGYIIVIIVGTTDGAIGLHLADVLAEKNGYLKNVTTLKVFFASQIFWSTGIASFRLAILFLYIEIFRKSRFYTIAISTAAVVAAYYVACILTIFLICRPLDFNWNKTLENGSCGNVFAIEVFSAAFNMSVDVWVVCLPLPIVWTLQMPLQKKVAISATFGLGLANAGINLGRLIQNIECNTLDFTYCLMGSAMFVIGEMSTGILVACVPTLGPIIFPRRFAQHAKALPQRSSNKILLKSGASNWNIRGGHRSDMPDSNKRRFESLDDEGIDLNGALNTETHGYEVHAAAINNPERPVAANGIGVRQDVYLYDIPQQG